MYRTGSPVAVLTLLVIVLALATSIAGLVARDLYSGNSISVIAQGRGRTLSPPLSLFRRPF